MYSQSLLSVIVPCYNVEKYLDKCILSIIGQTYSNMEILLIDDGSTDTTGKICDAWREKDRRIRVIHKQNEGLSYARKTGIENITAEYVTFVDADDWIDPKMYSDLMSALLSTNSDIAECDLCFAFEDGRIVHRIDNHDASIKTMGRIEGVAHIFEDNLAFTCFWNKIFKTKLFNGIDFHKDLAYGEDLMVYKLYHHALQSVYVNSEYYFYLQRSNSICNDKSIPAELKKLREWSDVLYESYDFVEKHQEYHSVLKIIRNYAMCVGLRLLHSMLTYPEQFTGEYYNFKIKQLRSIPLVKGDVIPHNAKRELSLLKISPALYEIFRRLYNRFIRFANRLELTDRRTCKFINERNFYWSNNQGKKHGYAKMLLKIIKKIHKKLTNPVRGEILMLHSVVAQKSRLDENRFLEITPAFLERTILKYKSAGYRFVSLDQIHQQIVKRKRYRRKFVCFTLDDGYADNYEQAYPVFKKHNCPFTIYVTTSYPDQKAQFWWYQLEDVVLKNEKITVNGVEYDCSDSDKKNRAFWDIREEIFSSNAKATLKSLEHLFKESECEAKIRALSWEQIAELAADPICTIAAHTVSHASLPTLNDEEIKKEMYDSKKRLEEKINKPVKHFSYPYGDHNSRVVKLAEQFDTAVLASEGYIKKKDSLYMLSRKNLVE